MVNQSQTTRYHQQGNGVVERNNWMLGDDLRSRSQKEWDAALPQIIRACCSTPHSCTQETPDFLMLGWETRVLEHLTYHVPKPRSPGHEYLGKLIEQMGVTLPKAIHDNQSSIYLGFDPLLSESSSTFFYLGYDRSNRSCPVRG